VTTKKANGDLAGGVRQLGSPNNNNNHHQKMLKEGAFHPNGAPTASLPDDESLCLVGAIRHTNQDATTPIDPSNIE